MVQIKKDKISVVIRTRNEERWIGHVIQSVIDHLDKPEIIIMVGYPGSGKSTIANNICKLSSNYINIQGDIYKTPKKMMRAAFEHIPKHKSVIFDATNSSIKKRREYIEFANKYNYLIRCIHLSTSLEDSYKRNKLRSDKDQVPKIAYSLYKKYFEEPTEDEGFKLINI